VVDFTPQVGQIQVTAEIFKTGEHALDPPTTQGPGQDAYYLSHLAHYSKPF